MVLIASVILASFAQQQEPADRPDALQALEDARRAIRTADVVWTETHAKGEQSRHRARFTADEFISEFLPNDEGLLVGPWPPSQNNLQGTRKYLRSSDSFHSHGAGHVFCEMRSRDDPAGRNLYKILMPDIRSLGMNPNFGVAPTALDEALISFPRPGIPREYSSETIDGIVHVTARLDTGREII